MNSKETLLPPTARAPRRRRGGGVSPVGGKPSSHSSQDGTATGHWRGGVRTSGSRRPRPSQSPTSWLFSPTYFESPLSKLREGAPGTLQEQAKPVTTIPTDSASFRYGGRESPNAAPAPAASPEPRPEAPRTGFADPAPGAEIAAGGEAGTGPAGTDLPGRRRPPPRPWLVAAHAPPLQSPRPAGAAPEAAPASGRSLVAPPRGRRPEVRSGLPVPTGHKLERGGRSSRPG